MPRNDETLAFIPEALPMPEAFCTILHSLAYRYLEPGTVSRDKPRILLTISKPEKEDVGYYKSAHTTKDDDFAMR